MIDRPITVSGRRVQEGSNPPEPTLLRYPGLVLVVDPSAKFATETMQDPNLSAEKDYFVIDPFQQAQGKVAEKRCSMNLIDLIQVGSNNLITNCSRLGDALHIFDSDARNAYWCQSALTLLRALVLNVVVNPRYEGKRNLLSLFEAVFLNVDALLEELEQSEKEFPEGRELLGPALQMLRSSENIQSGIISSVSKDLGILTHPAVISVLEKTDIDLGSLDPENTTIFLCLPLNAPSV